MKKYLGKILLAAHLTLWTAVFFMTSASAAYIDPSVASGVIMAVSGIIIAIGSVVIVWWRKAKRKVANKLGIDENANKEVEEDVVFNMDETENKDAE